MNNIDSNDDPIGITAYAYNITGHATKWSWKCKCGAWESEFSYRFLAVNDYKRHKTEECRIENPNLDMRFCILHHIYHCRTCKLNNDKFGIPIG